MQNDYWNEEPPIDPQDDTHPTQTVRQVNLNHKPSVGARLLGFFMLVGAAGLTLATIFMLTNQPEQEVIILPAPTQNQVVQQTTDNSPEDITPTNLPETIPTQEIQPVGNSSGLDPQVAEALLQQPLASFQMVSGMSIERDALNPFTIIPDRSRSNMEFYTAVRGDTIDGIAKLFNLEPETIAWSNKRSIVQVLRPGDVLNIPPVDGVFVTAIGSTRTIADYAALYKVDDPYAILDSEVNNLGGFSPDTVPPTGTQIFIPGGRGEEIVWVAEISVQSGGGGGANAAPDTVVFQNGQPGSCAPQAITGGSNWVNPIPSGGYTITRGFTPVAHPGIDLAGSVGIPIAAANGGRVIFAGWNGFGYGNAIAIIHGPNMTVYGHLSSVNVSCGQDVAAGQIIGAMGTTGNSSGPHLHFEIRSRAGDTYIAQDPGYTIGF